MVIDYILYTTTPNNDFRFVMSPIDMPEIEKENFRVNCFRKFYNNNNFRNSWQEQFSYLLSSDHLNITRFILTDSVDKAGRKIFATEGFRISKEDIIQSPQKLKQLIIEFDKYSPLKEMKLTDYDRIKNESLSFSMSHSNQNTLEVSISEETKKFLLEIDSVLESISKTYRFEIKTKDKYVPYISMMLSQLDLSNEATIKKQVDCKFDELSKIIFDSVLSLDYLEPSSDNVWSFIWNHNDKLVNSYKVKSLREIRDIATVIEKKLTPTKPLKKIINFRFEFRRPELIAFNKSFDIENQSSKERLKSIIFNEIEKILKGQNDTSFEIIFLLEDQRGIFNYEKTLYFSPCTHPLYLNEEVNNTLEKLFINVETIKEFNLMLHYAKSVLLSGMKQKDDQ